MVLKFKNKFSNAKPLNYEWSGKCSQKMSKKSENFCTKGTIK